MKYSLVKIVWLIYHLRAKNQGWYSMYSLIFTGLLVSLVFISGVAYYFYKMSSSDARNQDPQPFNQFLLGLCAAAFAIIIVFLFYIFVGDQFDIANNMGQVGDFIGGLTNPILSFLALLVLLRTTLIQTSESRRTTKFMESQYRLMEMEKFEGTFFQLLDRLDKYCDSHFRVLSGGKGNETVVSAIATSLTKARSGFDLLPSIGQYRAAKKLVLKLTHSDLCNVFNHRALRVVRLVDRSDLDLGTKRSYMGILRDTMLPDERIVLSSVNFFISKSNRELIRKWEVDYLVSSAYVCDHVANFYQSSEKHRAWAKPAELLKK